MKAASIPGLMKSVSFLLGAASSALLTLGFVRAASLCDPHLRHASITPASNLVASHGCEAACQLIAATGCEAACQLIAAAGCEASCQLIQQNDLDRSAQV